MTIPTVLNSHFLIAFLKAEWVGQKCHDALKLLCSYILTFCVVFFVFVFYPFLILFCFM